MARGSIGPRHFMGNEDRIKSEKTEGSEIERYSTMAEQVVGNHQLAAALAGEGLIDRASETSDEHVLLSMARHVLQNSPFIKKLIPDHLEDDESAQAAFLAAVAKKMSVLRNAMN